MRINNPKSFAGYYNEKSNDDEYKLATIKELNTLTNNLRKYVDEYTILFDDNKKIKSEALPEIAITNTYVYDFSEIKFTEINSDDIIIRENTFKNKLSEFLLKDPESSTKFQVGDIIIINNDTLTNETLDDEKFNNNNFYCGSYIISEVNRISDIVTTEEIKFSKLAYYDSNIMSINGIYPTKTDGKVSIGLSSILNEEKPQNISNIDKLTKDIYRISSIDEAGEIRFSFKSGDKDISYAKLDELKDEINLRQELSSVVNELKINSENNITELSSHIGNPGDPDGFETGSTIHSKINKLKNTLNNCNTNILSSAINNTNIYINELKEKIKSLNNKVVDIKQESLDWNTVNPVDLKNGKLIYTYTFNPTPTDPTIDVNIISILDDTGNQVITDIKKNKDNTFDIIIEHDKKIGDSDNIIKLSGNWKIIYSEKRTDLDILTDMTSIIPNKNINDYIIK